MTFPTRAIPLKTHDGKDAWKGKYQLQQGGMWFIARSNYGAILYATQEAALAGAAVCRDNDLRYNAVGRALPPLDTPTGDVCDALTLYEARVRAKLTQNALADLLGVSESTVVRLEASRRIIDTRWSSHLTLLFAHLFKQEETP